MTPLQAPPTFGQSLAGFCFLAQKTAQTKLTYRLSTLLSLTASASAYSVFLLVWSEVYRQSSRPGPLSREQMLSYLVLAFVVNTLMIQSVETRFQQRLRMGLVAGDLVRPLAFVYYQLAQSVGDLLVNIVYAGPIYLLGYWFAGAAILPATPLTAVTGVVALGFGFLIAFGLSYLIVQASFVLQSGYGVFFLRSALHLVFSGLSAPLVMFPPALRRVAEWLPFRHEIETPVRLFLGQVAPREVPGLLLTQAAWAFGLILAGDSIFRLVMRKHQVQGG